MSQPIPERKIQALQKWRSKLSPVHPDSRSCRGVGKEVNPSIKEMKAFLYWILWEFDPSFSGDYPPPGIRAVPNRLMSVFWAPVKGFDTSLVPPGSHYQERVDAYKKNLIAFARRPLGRKSIKRFVDQIRKLIRLSQAELEVISKGLAGDKGKYLTLFRDDKYPDIEIGLKTIALKQLGARYHHCLGQETGSESSPKIAIAFPDTEVHYFEYDSNYQECKKAWNKPCGYSVRKKKIIQELRAKYAFLAQAMKKSSNVKAGYSLTLNFMESASYQAVIEILKLVDEGLSSAVTLVSESGFDVLKDQISDVIEDDGVDPLLVFLQTYMQGFYSREIELLLVSVRPLAEEGLYDEKRVQDVFAEYLRDRIDRDYPGALEYILVHPFSNQSDLVSQYNYIVEHFGQGPMKYQYDSEGFSRKSRKGKKGSRVSTVRRTRRKASKERTHQKRRARKSMERQGVAKWNPDTKEKPKPKTAEDMSVVDHLSLTEAPSSVDELWGPWQQANSAELKEVYKLGMYASGPWLTQRLREVGFQKGRRLGAGSFGTVYALKNLNMEPTPWVAKVTGDVNEIAFVHRIIDLGIESSALPRVFGAWFSKPGIGLIIREDLYVHIASHFSRQMLQAIRRAAPFWFVGDKPELLPILPYEVAVFKRFSNEILRMKRLYGFSFIDLRPVNIRLRSTRAGQDELVISDFGMVSGPATKIPVIRNPRRRKFRS